MISWARKSLNLPCEMGWAYVDAWSVGWSASYMRDLGVFVGILYTV